tara:strand:+ start:167 stop:751 length:585 start_codon:yes stop_codon:yes gene_type:complete
MIKTRQILRLNAAGHPTGWINYQTAVKLYHLEQIAYECGSSTLHIKGGINRLTGLRSSLDINSIVATKSSHKLDYSSFTPCLNNMTLFMRDANTCLYCGEVFSNKYLSRDHIIPLSLGGEDIWTNVATACRRCNNLKGGKTPEDAKMMLIAVPFSPSRVEYLILRGRTILADQMEFLISHISKNSPLLERFKST